MASMPTESIHLVDRLAWLARARPDDPAIIDSDRTMSYRDVYAAAIAAAVRVRAAGIGRGDIVGILLEDSALYLIVVYALMRLGAIPQPIDRLLAAAEKEHLLRSFGTKMLICGPNAAAIGRTPLLPANDDWLGATADGSSIDDIACDPTLPCELAASSGTTGMPKAFLINHEQQHQRFQFLSAFAIGPHDRYLAVIGLHHNMGLRCGLAAIHLGGAVVLEQDVNSSAALMAVCARRRVSWTYVVPLHLRAFLARPQTELALPMLRRLFVAGAKLWSHERQAARERVTPFLYEIYGANEVGSVTLASPDEQIACPDTVGRPLPGFELQAVGPDDRVLPPGQIGLLRFRGPGMTQGYVGNPAANARHFRHGWFYPGDLGIVDAQGYVVLKGRGDDVINRSGLKIEPEEIEQALLGHPAVAEAAVVGWTTPQQQEVPFGFVVRRHDTDERQLIAFCRQRLAAYKVPVRIHFVPNLPKTGTGKVLRRQLRARLEQAAKR